MTNNNQNNTKIERIYWIIYKKYIKKIIIINMYIINQFPGRLFLKKYTNNIDLPNQLNKIRVS